jgi:hypothetical protein
METFRVGERPVCPLAPAQKTTATKTCVTLDFVMHLIFDAAGVPQHTQIELRTRLNQKINNLQPWSYSHFEWNTLYDPNNAYEKAGAERVSEACPVYNCHGLTFGSRRTQVENSEATLHMILEDDGFERINQGLVKPGDVVVYYDDGGRIEHTGIVVRTDDKFGVPKIWSKWGKGFEWIHPVPVCPFNSSKVQYYRLSKWKPEEILKRN